MSKDEFDLLQDVTNYLERNYTEKYGQGPIFITGSSVSGENPSDIDLVVKRKATPDHPAIETKKGEVELDSEEEVIDSMLRDLNSEDNNEYEFIALEEYEGNEDMVFEETILRTSRDVSHYPQTRYIFVIEKTQFDICFLPSTPDDKSICLTGPNIYR
ncbi:MAG: hypothetical protein ABEJ56_00930 [Candidatus Nanohaloarchaea archaeon]